LLLLSNFDNIMTTTKRAPKYASLLDYCLETRTRKVMLAAELGFSRFRFTALLYPHLYPVALTGGEIDRLAELLNQTSDYVRKLYQRAA